MVDILVDLPIGLHTAKDDSHTQKRRFALRPVEWPNEYHIQALANRASGQFVWASTALKLIDSHDPKSRLDPILAGDTARLGAENALYKLYQTALNISGDWDITYKPTIGRRYLHSLGGCFLLD